jgi:spore maturation protein CgeB
MLNPKIMIVDTYYPEVIKSLGFDNPSLLNSSYLFHLDELVGAGFGTGGAYRKGLRKVGWEAEIVIPNSRGLQTQWATEYLNSLPIQAGWSYGLHLARLPFVRGALHLFPHIQGLLLKQVQDFKPDVLYIQDLNLIPRALGRKLKKITKLFVGEIASPLPPRSYFREYDLIVSALPLIVEQVNSWGQKAQYLPLAFNEEMAVFSAASTRPIDVAFIGSFSRHQPQTLPLLSEVAKLSPGLRIYGPASPSDFEPYGLKQNYAGEAWGKDMLKVISQSKIIINRHGTIAGDYAVNMRMFETTGMGSLLVTENKSNLNQLFEVGKEVVGYDSPSEASSIIRDLLLQPQLIDEIALSGQKRTLGQHTYTQRAIQLAEILRDALSEKLSGY